MGSTKVVNARGLTAQNRNRLYFVGIRRSSAAGAASDRKGVLVEAGSRSVGAMSTTDEVFRFPIFGGAETGTDTGSDQGALAERVRGLGLLIPDLGLTFADIQQTEAELLAVSDASAQAGRDEMPVGESQGLKLEDVRDYTVSDAQFAKLSRNKAPQPSTLGSTGTKSKQKPPKTNRVLLRALAWHERKVEPLISHYGRSVTRGNSMLVPRPWPNNPRRFTVRECARIMGFPDWSYIVGFDSVVGESADKQVAARRDVDTYNVPVSAELCKGVGSQQHQKKTAEALIFEHYRMLGNAVCPPVICALGGAVLEHMGTPTRVGGSAQRDSTLSSRLAWGEAGLVHAVRLALDAIAPRRRVAVAQRLAREWGLDV